MVRVSEKYEWTGGRYRPINQNNYTNGRKPYNVMEDNCLHFFVGRGVLPNRRGWPDFWWIEDGVLHVVEVKPRETSPLKKHQQTIMEILKKHGVKTHRYDPSGLREI